MKSIDDLEGERRALLTEQERVRASLLEEWTTMGVQLARARQARLTEIDTELKRIAATVKRRLARD